MYMPEKNVLIPVMGKGINALLIRISIYKRELSSVVVYVCILTSIDAAASLPVAADLGLQREICNRSRREIQLRDHVRKAFTATLVTRATIDVHRYFSEDPQFGNLKTSAKT